MGAVAGHTAAIYIATNTSSVNLPGDDVLTDSGDHTTFTEATASHRYWDDSAVPVVQDQFDDIQTVTITGSPAGGTFTLTFGGNTTSGIAYNASAATVQAALVALASIGSGNASVTGSAGGPWTVEFISSLGYASQSVMTKNASGLTGGSSPDVSIAHTQTGQTWTTASASLYTVQYVGGKIIFNSPLSGTPQVRVHSGGKYFAYTTYALGTDWDLQGTRLLADSTVFGGGRAKTWIPTLFEGVFNMKAFWIDNTFLNDIQTGFRLIFSGSTDGTKRYESYSYTKADKIHAPLTGLVEEQMSFQTTGAWFYN